MLVVSQSAVSKVWRKCKQNGKAVKEKHTGLNSVELTSKKAKPEPSLTPAGGYSEAKEKQLWNVEEWMKVIFCGDDAGIYFLFFWFSSNETHKDDCLKKTSKYPQQLII